MVSTPIWIAKGYGYVRNYSGRIFAIGKRIATLEERVSELEAQLRKQPGDACPYCGERAMRLTKQSGMVKGDRPKWTEEIWTCGDCTQTFTKSIILGKT